VYRVAVTERIMIAHSFRGEVFGPAQQLHGATYVIEAAFRREELDPDGLVVDIALAHDVLRAVLEPVNYRNLDDLDVFAGVNTTTEFLARWVADQVVARARAGELGPHVDGLAGVTVTLRESDVAWASFDAALA
jgi:6-pyruvoyl-tetrahydropterin synthase